VVAIFHAIAQKKFYIFLTNNALIDECNQFGCNDYNGSLIRVLLTKRTARSVMAYSTIGLQLAITILLFIYVGYKADEHFRSSPWLFILSVVLGMTAGFYNLIRELRNIDRFLENKPAADSQDGEKRTKWL